jgi:hypothetical protein
MKKIIPILILIVLFVGCSVTYKKYTGVTKCDFAIMLAKIKSQKGNNAFEIGRYVDKCYEELDRIKKSK